MPKNQEAGEAMAALFVMGTVSLSMGVGYAFGAPFGWITFGVLCLATLVLAWLG